MTSRIYAVRPKSKEAPDSAVRLIRADLVMETSARAMVEEIRSKAGMPFFFGKSA